MNDIQVPKALLNAAPSPSHSPVDAADYRKALGCFATGVTVVSARWQHTDWGMTCNSFASVSLDPALVLWSIRREASSLDAFLHSGGFTVNVLSADQSHLARQFATGPLAERWQGVPVERLASERLRLSESVAWFDCRLHQSVAAGDHWILIGEVQHYGWQDDTPLTYCRSQMGRLSPL